MSKASYVRPALFFSLFNFSRIVCAWRLTHPSATPTESPLETNVLVTGILARLAACADRQLHIYLLSPLFPGLDPGARSPLTVLRDVWDEADRNVKNMREYRRRLESVRRRLAMGEAGMSTELADDRRVLEGVVVYEEFIKELVAVVQVKDQIHSLSLAYKNDREAS